MSSDSVDVAYYMLKIANEKDIEITNLKLQKLAYIAHGYVLAINGEPLINEAPQAWKYGPVVHSIYHQFKQYESEVIVVNTQELNFCKLSESKKLTISSVLNIYSEDSALDLVNLTCAPGTPWDILWSSPEREGQLFVDIPNTLIKNHFLKAVTDPESINGL